MQECQGNPGTAVLLCIMEWQLTQQWNNVEWMRRTGVFKALCRTLTFPDLDPFRSHRSGRNETNDINWWLTKHRLKGTTIVGWKLKNSKWWLYKYPQPITVKSKGKQGLTRMVFPRGTLVEQCYFIQCFLTQISVGHSGVSRLLYMSTGQFLWIANYQSLVKDICGCTFSAAQWSF